MEAEKLLSVILKLLHLIFCHSVAFDIMCKILRKFDSATIKFSFDIGDFFLTEHYELHDDFYRRIVWCKCANYCGLRNSGKAAMLLSWKFCTGHQK